MDPDAALEELLTLTTARLTRPNPDDATGSPSQTDPADPADSVRAAELVQSLDEWFRAGGFLPRRWAQHRPTR